MVARYDRAMQSSRPLLVVVSGAPASGKTTLAQRLAADGALTLLSKDAIKEALADSLGHPETVDASGTLGTGAYAAMFAMAARLVESGTSIGLESNFRRGRAEPDLARLAGIADPRVVHCVADAPTIRRRYEARAPERHAAHLDAARRKDVMRELRGGLYDPLDLGWPLAVVRTDDGYAPAYDEIRTFALGRRSG